MHFQQIRERETKIIFLSPNQFFPRNTLDSEQEDFPLTRQYYKSMSEEREEWHNKDNLIGA